MKIILLIFCTLGFVTCTPAIHIFKWIEGTWEMRLQENNIRQEIWKMKGATELTGIGRKITATDTMVLENLRLVYQNQEFWYIPTVADQNDGKPVKFRLVERQERRFVFENPAHDFPQRIIYDFLPVSGSKAAPGDSLLVRVEGNSGGQEKGINFMFLRKE